MPMPCREELPKGYSYLLPVAGWEIAGILTISEVTVVGDQLRLGGELFVTRLNSPEAAPSRAAPLKLQATAPIPASGTAPIIADHGDLANWNVPYLQLDGAVAGGVIRGRMAWAGGWFPYGTMVRGTFTLRRR